jgi:hypothetical protein
MKCFFFPFCPGDDKCLNLKTPFSSKGLHKYKRKKGGSWIARQLYSYKFKVV